MTLRCRVQLGWVLLVLVYIAFVRGKAGEEEVNCLGEGESGDGWMEGGAFAF